MANFFSNIFSKKLPEQTWQLKSPTADFDLSSANLVYGSINTYSYNGEKNLGEAGPIVDYRLAYQELRLRSWQAQLESDTAQIGINRLVGWTIGEGLKPQYQPAESVLKSYGITLPKEIRKNVESRFNLFRESKCDYAGMLTLDEIEWEAERNALIGGDVLVILRLVKGKVTVQLIDGCNVMSPYYGTEWFPQALSNGNRIIDGVEVNRKGKHVAFYVRSYTITGDVNDIFAYKFERIEATGRKSGLQMAYLYYGSKHRINNVRGIPALAACLEKLKQMDQYTSAVLKQAKEASRVDYQQVTDVNGSGESVFAKNLATASNINGGKPNLPTTADLVELSKLVRVSTGNESFVNPPGSRLEMLENKNVLYYKDFNEVNQDGVFATLTIPPNVAMSKYNDSFSASRAAIKDWEHTLKVKRKHETTGFKQPIFNMWFENEVLSSNISAPGYLAAKATENDTIIGAYRCVRFLGANVPHIDPVKEVTAARLKAGSAAAHLPLDDMENLTEQLDGGDYKENVVQMGEEISDAKANGIIDPLTLVNQAKPEN